MQPNGSGLGLYIVKNIANRHGSEVRVESEVGKGSTFSFMLPTSKEDLEKTQPTVDAFFGSF